MISDIAVQNEINDKLEKLLKSIKLQNVLISNLIRVCSKDSFEKEKVAENSEVYRERAEKQYYEDYKW